MPFKQPETNNSSGTYWDTTPNQPLPPASNRTITGNHSSTEEEENPLNSKEEHSGGSNQCITDPKGSTDHPNITPPASHEA
jgi:hypothetical protein